MPQGGVDATATTGYKNCLAGATQRPPEIENEERHRRADCYVLERMVPEAGIEPARF